MIGLLVHLVYPRDAEYNLSIDSTVFTAFGEGATLTKAIVRKSNLHSKYTKVIVLPGIICLDTECFYECISLKDVELSSTIQRVNNYAFSFCSLLTSLTLPAPISFIGSNIIYNSPVRTINLPSTLTDLSSNSFKENSLVSFYVDYGGIFSTTKDHKLLIKNGVVLFRSAGMNTNITIPGFIEVIFENAFYSHRRMKTITFEPGNLTEIQYNAFYSCSIITYYLPVGLKVLADSLFDRSLVITVYLPWTLTKVADGVFNDAYSLTNVYAYKNCTGLIVQDNGVITSQNGKAIIFIPSLIDNFTLNWTVEKISVTILPGLSYLTSLNVDDNHTVYKEYNNTLYIKNYEELFCGIGGAKIIKIHPNCTKVGLSAFKYIGIEEVDFSGCRAFTTIEGYSFGACNKITKFILPDSLESIGNYAFNSATLPDLELGSNVNKIEAYGLTFLNINVLNMSKCTKLIKLELEVLSNSKVRKLILPEGLQSIGENALSNTQNLNELVIPSTVQILGKSCLASSAVSKVTFAPESELKTIGNNALKWTKITSFDLPNSVNEIAEGAFAECKTLKNVNISSQSNLSTINLYAFQNCGITSLVFGDKLRFIGYGSFAGINTLTSLSVSEGNEFYSHSNGVLYTRNKTQLVVCPSGKTEVSILDSAETIAGSAFFECTLLANVTFGTDSLLSVIGTSTFFGCTALESIEMPGGLTEIQECCFKECERLKSIIFNEDCKVETISKEAFSGCRRLEVINLYGCYYLGELGGSSFYGCTKLQSVVLPTNLTKIGSSSFADCVSLKMMVYCGKIISFESNVFDGSNDVEVFVSSSYESDKFGGVGVTFLFDKDCRLPTGAFTARSFGVSGICSSMVASASELVFEGGKLN